jgi:hypothetical protein
MTYSSGGLIQAADYNGFANDSANNIGNVWAVGSTDKGWGQANIANVSTGATVTATQWATLVNTLTSMSNQTGVAITSRTAPVAGNTISVLANVATDINNLTLYRGNATAVGAQVTLNGSSAGPAESTNAAGWNMTFTQTITFASAAAARYFWNAGGRIAITTSKSSTGTDKDPDWNAFAATTGVVTMVGRVNGAAQTIAGVSYTGTNKTGGSGSPTTLQTTTGWYNLTPGAAAVTVYAQFDAVSPYSGDYIAITAAVNSGSTVLTLQTIWHDNGYTLPGENNAISAGATTALSYYPPSTTYLSNSWGTPTLASSVV